MAQIIIDTGAAANDGTGDPLRTAFTDINTNFTEIYTAGPVASNVRIANNTIRTITTNGNLVLAPNGVGVVQSNVNIVPNSSNIRNLGSSTQRWSSLYVQYASISGNLDLAGTLGVGDLSVTGNLTVTGNTIQIGNLVTDSKTIQLSNTANTANAANGSGITVGVNDDIATLLYSNTANAWTTNIGVSAVGNITGNYILGNGSQLTGLPATYGNSNVATFLAAFGSNTVSTTGNITAANFFGNGNTLSNVATTFESTWTVPVGNSTQSFTVTPNNTYYLWVDCSIANGILVWNATATVTNTNVPVVGAQYAWVYDGGGTPIDFTSIPNQFVGTANTIVRSSVAPSATTNRFDFGINNTSGGNVTVRYGWIIIS